MAILKIDRYIKTKNN